MGSRVSADQGRAASETEPQHQALKTANGMADQQANQAGDDADRATMRRAEEMVDQVAERVGQFTSYLGRKILQLGARAREEA